MHNEPMLPRILKMLPIAEAGFPDVMCPVIFLGGCNFKCPYCLNSELVTNPTGDKTIPVDEVIKYCLDNGEESILISGGEPCLQPGLGHLVDLLQSNGISVRLSTNGSRADILEEMIYDHGVSFVAMDIKTDLFNSSKWSMFMDEMERDEVLASMTILNYHDVKRVAKGFSFEFRTTLYPPAVGEMEIEAISSRINPKAIWYLQQFRPRDGLLSTDASSVTPYTKDEVNFLLAVAKERVSKTFVRWP
jgi:pyruvate formate lyase activating enzyme